MVEDERRRRAGMIIHAAAVASAGTAAVLSKKSFIGALVRADTPILTAIAGGMVIGLGGLFGQNIGNEAAISILSKYAGQGLRVLGTRTMVGWVPIIGNVASAAITFGFMEELGWGIYSYFEERQGKRTAEPESRAAQSRNIERRTATPERSRGIQRINVS